MTRPVLACALLGLSFASLAASPEREVESALSAARQKADELSAAARYDEAHTVLAEVIAKHQATAPEKARTSLKAAQEAADVYARRAALAKNAPGSVDDSKALLKALLFDDSRVWVERPTTADARIRELVERLREKDRGATLLAPRVVRVRVGGTAPQPVLDAISREVQSQLASYGFFARGSGPNDRLEISASATEPREPGAMFGGAATSGSYLCAVKAGGTWTAPSKTELAVLDLSEGGISAFPSHCQQDYAARGAKKVVRELIRVYLGLPPAR